ncbi:hypothetical protein [Ideonella paludis]|uniref:hypothetical protein n=1 Tax=Ideonella paludis TaxID=1233411 RepID=UPI003633C49D
MHEMDLIPAAYRQRRVQQQRRRLWWLGIGLLVFATVGARLWIERGLAQERAWKAQWQPQQDKARAQRNELTQLQTLIAQARALEGPAADAHNSAPLALLPGVLAALPEAGLRLSSASLEPTADTTARLTLQGQAADEATLGRTVTLLQGHAPVSQVQLLSVKPEVHGEQRFELLLRVSASPLRRHQQRPQPRPHCQESGHDAAVQPALGQPGQQSTLGLAECPAAVCAAGDLAAGPARPVATMAQSPSRTPKPSPDGGTRPECGPCRRPSQLGRAEGPG